MFCIVIYHQVSVTLDLGYQAQLASPDSARDNTSLTVCDNRRVVLDKFLNNFLNFSIILPKITKYLPDHS